MQPDPPTPYELMEAILDLKGAVEFGLSRIAAKLDDHDRRFDAHDRRFDAYDRRLDAMDFSLAKRFDHIDRRLDAVESRSAAFAGEVQERFIESRRASELSKRNTAESAREPA